jgi:hypothetical protein
MLQDPMTVMKFGYIWALFQPDKNDFAEIILKMLMETENLLLEFLKNEKLSHADVGYRKDSKLVML